MRKKKTNQPQLIKVVKKSPRKAPASAVDGPAFDFRESRETKGEEKIGRKKIPFSKVEQGGGWSQITYGCSEVWKLNDRPEILTCLVKTVRPGHTEWKTISTNRVLSKGAASNILQGNKDALSLFYWVKTARRRRPSELQFKIIGSRLEVEREINPFDCIMELVARDITGGTTYHVSNLLKCIEAVVADESKSKTEKILMALKALAERFNRVPTKNEVLNEFDKVSGNYGYDEGNFMRALASAGLAWLPTKYTKKHEGS